MHPYVYVGLRPRVFRLGACQAWGDAVADTARQAFVFVRGPAFVCSVRVCAEPCSPVVSALAIAIVIRSVIRTVSTCMFVVIVTVIGTVSIIFSMAADGHHRHLILVSST